MKKRNPVLILLLVLLAIMAMGVGPCATVDVKVPAVSEMTPLDRATMAMDVYANMSKDYRAQVARPNLSAAEKQVLETKYAILKEAGPKVKTYNEIVKGTKPPDAALAEWIVAFLNNYRY